MSQVIYIKIVIQEQTKPSLYVTGTKKKILYVTFVRYFIGRSYIIQ